MHEKRKRSASSIPLTSSLFGAGQEEDEMMSDMEREGWALLYRSVVTCNGKPVGTIAACDPDDKDPANYDQVFVRDFVASAFAFLLRGDFEIVKNFLQNVLELQSWEKTVDCYKPGPGLMPASFKVRTADDGSGIELLDPDFGEAAIGRVAPVDSGFWWIILLRVYGRITEDYSLQQRKDFQKGVKLILELCLSDGFDMFPTLLVTDGSCMIDRRMGIHGHPLEIQALFYAALRSSLELLVDDDENRDIRKLIEERICALSLHVREYYWADKGKLNEIYRYKTEEYSREATNKFNIYPSQIPTWLLDWIPDDGGYLIGNLQPAHMDFRFFSLGNLWAIISSLATPNQSQSIIDLIEAKWEDLMGKVPMKICFPALDEHDWSRITGSDPKNIPWSYHNGGSWPTLLWHLTLACIKEGRPGLAERAILVAEKKLSDDKWPEYYDTKSGRFIGKEARMYQTWTIAGFLASKLLLKKREIALKLVWDEDTKLQEACGCTPPRASCLRQKKTKDT